MEFLCLNPMCVYRSHLVPTCPYQPPPPLPPRRLTNADREAYRRLRQLREDGTIKTPLPGERGSSLGFLAPFALVFALPVLFFLFFVLVMLLG
ncbi:hypothetical protein NMK54_34295 [Nocardia otitidiscaviarum]|uniref:hypothetical protein n=1 Tax=Nocardia otitidiscaviarum TaxID=1823 RepID=UPI0020CC7B6C|nr:hypothetical protein [Nocardia otitidiscaviarum]MCP9625218.1 hypothetical protein [Nocardia otitidiscaviarum]